MRTYKDINNPTVGDILQALDIEGIGTVKDLTYLVRDRMTYPSLYSVMDTLEDEGEDTGQDYTDTRVD